MVRRGRDEYQGAVYHVIQRGNNRENVFDSPELKEYLIDLLGKSVVMDGVEIYSYVIMNNHYHLALRTDAEKLSKVMHRINIKYSMYYNRIMNRTGHVFQGRYKSIPVHDDNYLIALVKYIHRNPVRAGICMEISDYPWSSDIFYRTADPGFIEVGLLMDILSQDRKKSFEKYNILMDQEDNPGIKEPVITENNKTERPNQTKKPSGGRKALDEILKETGINQEEVELIKKGSRLRRLTPAKAAYAVSAREQGYSLNEIACHIGVSSVAVIKYMSKNV